MNTSITNEQRDERYNSLPSHIQFLYTNHTSGRTMWEVFEHQEISKSLYTDYAILVGDIILGFYPKSDLQKLLVSNIGVTEVVAQNIVSGLSEFLSPIEDSTGVAVAAVPVAPKEVLEKLDLGPITMKNDGGIEGSKAGEVPPPTLGNVPNASNNLREQLELRPKNVIRQPSAVPKVEDDEEDDGPKPLTRTQILQSLTSKRTMASDIASIHKSRDTNTHT